VDHKPVESRLIKSFKYDEMNELLEIRFMNGSLHEYKGVPEKAFLDFERAKSFGGHFLKHIKPAFASRKIEGVHAASEKKETDGQATNGEAAS
jgi:hypothetical protein